MIKRYNFVCYSSEENHCGTESDNKGYYVKYEDYEKIEEELQRALTYIYTRQYYIMDENFKKWKERTKIDLEI